MPRPFSSVLAPLLAAYSSGSLLLFLLGPGNGGPLLGLVVRNVVVLV